MFGIHANEGHFGGNWRILIMVWVFDEIFLKRKGGDC